MLRAAGRVLAWVLMTSVMTPPNPRSRSGGATMVVIPPANSGPREHTKGSVVWADRLGSRSGWLYAVADDSNRSCSHSGGDFAAREVLGVLQRRDRSLCRCQGRPADTR